MFNPPVPLLGQFTHEVSSRLSFAQGVAGPGSRAWAAGASRAPTALRAAAPERAVRSVPRLSQRFGQNVRWTYAEFGRGTGDRLNFPPKAGTCEMPMSF